MLLFVQLLLKMLSGMTNPHQSDLGVHCLHMNFVRNLSVQNFRTSTIPLIQGLHLFLEIFSIQGGLTTLSSPPIIKIVNHL